MSSPNIPPPNRTRPFLFPTMSITPISSQGRSPFIKSRSDFLLVVAWTLTGDLTADESYRPQHRCGGFTVDLRIESVSNGQTELYAEHRAEKRPSQSGAARPGRGAANDS